jgi:hypothetical protein
MDMAMMSHRRLWILLAVSAVWLGLFWGCTDLEKYQRPESNRTSPPPPQTRSIEIRLSPEERQETQAFATVLQDQRQLFDSEQDTVTMISVLDSLATAAAERWHALPDTSGARRFYIIANADVLNELFVLRRASGDEMGARRAQRLLMELKPHLPQ